MVHRDRAVRLQVVPDLLHRVAGEQVALEPKRRLTGEDRERVGDRVEDEVVAAIGVVEEGPAVLDVHGDPRVLVRMIRMAVAAEPIQERIDLHGVDALGAVRQRDRDVVAAAGADDEHVRERVGGRVPVRLEPMFLRRLHQCEGHDPLVGTAVHVDRHGPVVHAGPGGHPVVRRPQRVRREGEHPEDGDSDGERHELHRPPPGTDGDHDRRRDHPPHERRSVEERENGERNDPQDAPDDVPAVRLQRRETDEDAPHALGDRGHDQEGEQEDDPEGEPFREGRPPEPADELQPARPRGRPARGTPPGTGRGPRAELGRSGRDRSEHGRAGTRSPRRGSWRAARSS